MFNWLTQLIVSIAAFLGISSPAVLPFPIADLTPTPITVVSTMPTATPTPIPTTSLTKAPYPTSQARADISLIQKYLSKPSPDAFKQFCIDASAAKTNLYRTEDVLNTDKTGIQTVRRYFTLAELMSCDILGQNYTPVTREYAITILTAPLTTTDSDEARLAKIQFNESLNQYIANQSVVLLRVDKPARTRGDLYVSLAFPENELYQLLSELLEFEHEINPVRYSRGGLPSEQETRKNLPWDWYEGPIVEEM